MSNIKKYIGQEIKSFRLTKNISQEKLAELSGLHRTYISEVELGKRNISIINLEKIANALNIPLYELFKEAEKNE